MIKIAIVEDEAVYIEQLTGYLRQYEKEQGEVIEVTVYNDGDDIVRKYRSQFDIILMDIEMKFMDGMSAAEEIRRVDSEVMIVFITNMAQYAIKGYEVNALDYVLKPITYFAFSQRLAKAVARIKNRSTKNIIISVKGGTMRLDTANVFYVESQGHTLIYHTASGNYESLGAMKDVEDKLTDLGFFRGNKGYLVNLSHVDEVQEGCAIVKGEKLLLSRSRKKAFMEALTRYWGEVI